MENNVNTTENASNEEQSKPLKQGAVMRSLLWKIACRIKDLQKKASEMTDEQKKNISWEMLEEDWFDYLEEELSNWTEDFINGAKWQQQQNKNLYSEEEVRKMLEDATNYVSAKEMRDNYEMNFSEWKRMKEWFVNYLFDLLKNK